jgi:hypothetical protein
VALGIELKPLDLAVCMAESPLIRGAVLAAAKAKYGVPSQDAASIYSACRRS